MRVGERCGVAAISLGYSCIVLVALVLYIQLGIGIRNKVRRQLNGNLGCLGNIQGVGFYYLFSLSSTICLGTNYNNIILRGNIKRVGRSIICGRLYFQICTNLNLFNVINVFCSVLLIFLSLFIRDTGCNRRNSLLDFRITSSYFLRCCRNCLCSFFSHASLFQLLLTRSGSFANSRNDRNLVVLNQCNAEEVRRFIDSTSNILLAVRASVTSKVCSRVAGEVTARDGDTCLRRTALNNCCLCSGKLTIRNVHSRILTADVSNSVCSAGESTARHGKRTKINISSATTVVNAVCFRSCITCSSKCAALDFCNIVIHNNCLIIVGERTVNNRYLCTVIILNRVQTATEQTAINRQRRLINSLVGSVVTRIKVSIRDKAGKFAKSSIVPSSLHRYSIFDGHSANILDGVPRVLATLAFVLAIFLRAIKSTAIYNNCSLIVQRSRTMRYIINSTLAVNGQSTIVADSMACNIRQFLAIQVKCNGLVSRNNNIFSCVFQQSNRAAISSHTNCICYRVIICTSICYCGVFALNNGIGSILLSGIITLCTEVCARIFCQTISRIKIIKGTARNNNLGLTNCTRCIIAVQHKLICLSCIWILLLNRI